MKTMWGICLSVNFRGTCCFFFFLKIHFFMRSYSTIRASLSIDQIKDPHLTSERDISIQALCKVCFGGVSEKIQSQTKSCLLTLLFNRSVILRLRGILPIVCPIVTRCPYRLDEVVTASLT